MKKDKKKSPSSYILGDTDHSSHCTSWNYIYLSVNLIHSRENTLQSQTEIQETNNSVHRIFLPNKQKFKDLPKIPRF